MPPAVCRGRPYRRNIVAGGIGFIDSALADLLFGGFQIIANIFWLIRRWPVLYVSVPFDWRIPIDLNRTIYETL